MKSLQSPMSRRGFLQAGSLTLCATALPARNLAASGATGQKLFSAIGIAAPLVRAAALKAAGAQFLTENVGNLLIPDKPEAEFEHNLAKLAASPLPVLACNGFIRPAHLRCTGPQANHDLVGLWAETTFRRMERAGGKIIVFGSGSSRQLPDGWPKEKADAQFVSLLKRLGPLAETHGVTVALEQLQARECNYINRIGEAAAIIRSTGHPSVRLLADLYHMVAMGDTPADLSAAMDIVAHVEIAEKEDRTVPGVHGDDFRPFFRVLRESGYQGAISIEGKSTDNQIKAAFAEITKQASET